MALIEADKEKYKDKIKKFCKKIIRLRSRSGIWGYGRGFRQSLAYPNTFFAVLGLHMADSVDDKLVPDRVWRKVLKRMKILQTDNGGWSYGGHVYGTQTAAGTAILMICSKHLNKDKSLKEIASADEIKQGLKWLDKCFITNANPLAPAAYAVLVYHFLFATGVAATLAKIERFNDKNWYQEGVQHILEELDEVENWSKEAPRYGHTNILLDTALMLLFLKKDFVVRF
jgi:prenyltransferase beta subunit